MPADGRLEHLDDRTWPAFRDAPIAVLVLSRSGCPHCAAWAGELESFLADDAEWTDVRFGKLMIDGERIDAFREENDDWLDMIPGVPFTALYRDGQPVTSLAGGGVDRLVNRLRNRIRKGD